MIALIRAPPATGAAPRASVVVAVVSAALTTWVTARLTNSTTCVTTVISAEKCVEVSSLRFVELVKITFGNSLFTIVIAEMASRAVEKSNDLAVSTDDMAASVTTPEVAVDIFCTEAISAADISTT